MPQQPTLARRTLGLAFRRHRRSLNRTMRDVAAATGWSDNTIARIEGGQQPTRLSQAKALCDYFELPPEEKSRLCGLATQSGEPGWWEPYFDKSRGAVAQPRSPLFLETEREARRIWVLELEVVPGLLQTLEYLRAVQDAGLPMAPGSAEAAQGLRAHRQQGLDERDDAAELEFIIGHAAMVYLDQLPAAVRDGQRERIREMAARPNVTVRVLNSLHAATAGSFTVLTPGDELPAFVYLDAVDGCRYIEDPDVVSLYERTFAAARDSTEIL